MTSIEKGMVIALAIAVVFFAYFVGRITAGIDCWEIVQELEKDDD